MALAGVAHAADAPAPSQPSLELFAVGDWGIDSPDRQKVADAMATYATAEPAHKPQDVLLLGDNFYINLTGVDDPRIHQFFDLTYDAKKLDVPFYAVLGNHDYKGDNASIEMKWASQGKSRFTLPSRWYRLELPAEHPVVSVFMLDSDQPYMPNGMWDQETQWLKTELAKPHAPWVICCAHHDMFGNGSHGDNGVLQTTWGPLFKEYHVPFYICGHEHTLQHLEIPGWPISFVIAGGGGAARKPMLRDLRGPFSRASLGFAAMTFTPDVATISLIDGDDQVVHEFTRSADGAVKILMNTPSDKATKHPLRVLQGIDAPSDQVGGPTTLPTKKVFGD